MTTNPVGTAQNNADQSKSDFDFDAIGIGAGFAGLALIHYLRETGLSVRILDRGSDVGGTWNWNCYPGAATDSESYYYCLTFSKELLQKWSWTKRYPGWKETQAYMKFVADECDMWPHIQFDTEVVEAEYMADRGGWQVKTAGGETLTCQYLISGMGMISEPMIPKIEGIESFEGSIFHSSRWPRDLDYAGKKVAVIGSGSTTVQMVPVLAETAQNVTVFQRTPNYILPAMQRPMTAEWEKEIKDNYDAIVQKCRDHSFGMAFDSPTGRTVEGTSLGEVQRVFEENWKGSFRWVFETFDDLLTNREANRLASEFITTKMKEQIDDPEIADLVAPNVDDYPLFAKRPPLDQGYLKSLNRHNVTLVDIKKKEPLVEITADGIKTTQNSYEFDIIVLATGFKAYTGALEAFPIRGDQGETLNEKWQRSSDSIMGVCVAGFPNLFIVTGPQAPFANLPTSIEQNVIWISRCIQKMRHEGYNVFKPRIEAEKEWTAHTADIHNQTLMACGDEVNSWMMGANRDDKGPRVLIYFGGANAYYDRMDQSADEGFPELEFVKLDK